MKIPGIGLSRTIRSRLRSVPIMLLLTVFAFFMILPFLWMLSASFKTQRTAMVFPIQWIPQEWHWENYLTVLHINSNKKDYHFLLAYWNSIKVSVINTFGCMLTSS